MAVQVSPEGAAHNGKRSAHLCGMAAHDVGLIAHWLCLPRDVGLTAY